MISTASSVEERCSQNERQDNYKRFCRYYWDTAVKFAVKYDMYLRYPLGLILSAGELKRCKNIKSAE